MTLQVAQSRLVISYGGFFLTPANGITISSEYNRGDLWEGWARTGNVYVEFNLSLANPTGNVAIDDGAFQTLLATMRAALTVPRQRLLVTFGGATVIEDLNQLQTAFFLQPELTLLEQNARDYRFGFRVRCQLPGNIPGNNFRRESALQTTFGNAQRRICAITASWTANAGTTAVENYVDFGDTFFDAALPAPLTDQFGIAGEWTEAGREEGPVDDESATITVRRVYWEVFNGRQQSEVELDALPMSGASIVTGSVIGMTRFETRRECRVPARWAPSGGRTALENYLTNGPAAYTALLPTNVSGCQWVLVDANPTWTEEDPIAGAGVLQVVHTYREVDSTGLWDFYAELSTNGYNVRTASIAGVYYETASATAAANYAAGIDGLITAVTTALGIAVFDAVAVPNRQGYGVTQLYYRFQVDVHEISYAQGPGGADDPKVLFETLDLVHLPPHDPQSMTPAIPVTRLDTVRAVFSARMDVRQTLDPTAYWESTLRAFVITRITSLLGANVTSVRVVQERVGPTIGDQVNHLNGELVLVVLGGTVLQMHLKQHLNRRTTRDFKGRGDGTLDTYYPYRRIPEKPYRLELVREGWCEYVIGAVGMPPTLFHTGDLTVSGLDFVDPSIDAAASLDAQDATGTLSGAPGWFCQEFDQEDYPTTRGDSAPYFQTAIHGEYQRWLYAATLQPGTSL